MSKKRTSQKIIALAMAAAMCAGTGAMATTTGSFLTPSLVVSAADEEATPLSDFTAYSSFPQRLQSYNGSAESIVIPAKNSKGDYFTAIGYNSNYQFLTDSVNEVTSVSFEKGNHITTIGSGAFRGYTKLETIVLPEGLTKIDTNAFQGCTGLKEIVIPSTVTSIGSKAFMDCTNLQTITFKSRSTADLTLGQSTFENCTALETVNIEDNSVSTMGYGTFKNCTGLKLVKLGKGVTQLGGNAFANCTNMRVIVIPSTCTSINSSTDAFSGCTNLTVYGEQGSYVLTTYANKNKKLKYTEMPQNTSKISNEKTAPIGTDVILTPALSGGYSSGGETDRMKNFEYKVEIAKADGEVIEQTDWLRQGTAPKYYFQLPEIGTYKITVVMKDEKGVDATETFSLKAIEVSDNLTADVQLSSEYITLGKSLSVNVDANGGSGGYTYSIQCVNAEKDFASPKYSKESAAEFTPEESGDYLVRVSVKDSAKTVIEKYMNFTVAEKLKNVSTVSLKGNEVTVNVKGAGGSGNYTYGVYYKKDTASVSNWTCKISEKTSSTQTVKISLASSKNKETFTPAVYNVCVKVKDAETGTVVKKYFNIAHNLTVSASLSAESVKLGDTVKIHTSANGGSGNYNYAVYYKQKAQSNWTTKQYFSDNADVSIKPAKATDYDICIKAKDANGTVVKKYFTVNVTA